MFIRKKAIVVGLILFFVHVLIYKTQKSKLEILPETKIIVVTPTYKRPERMADMTSLAQTLMHVKNLIWIVIEDGKQTSNAVRRLLMRSGIKHHYLFTSEKLLTPGKHFFKPFTTEFQSFWKSC